MAYVAFQAGEILTAGKLNTRLIEEVMEWTLLSAVGTYATNFSANAGDPPRMRKIMTLGQERWEYEGRIAVAPGGLTANFNTLAFTFDVGFRPSVERGWQVAGGNTLFYGVRTTISSAGALMVGIPTAGGNNANGILLDGIYIDNPTL